jgi:hypothetical protein
MEHEFERKLREERAGFVKQMMELQAELKTENPLLNEMISKIGAEKPAEKFEPMVPMADFQELSTKCNIIESENNFLKSTLKTLGGGNITGNDIISAMQKTAAEEAGKAADLLKENQYLKLRIGQYEGKPLTKQREIFKEFSFAGVVFKVIRERRIRGIHQGKVSPNKNQILDSLFDTLLRIEGNEEKQKVLEIDDYGFKRNMDVINKKEEFTVVCVWLKSKNRVKTSGLGPLVHSEFLEKIKI